VTNLLTITSQPEASVIALNEIQKIIPAARGKRLTPEVQLVSHADQLNLAAAQTIFIRHTFPVQLEADLSEANLATRLAELCEGFAKTEPFSIQLRGPAVPLLKETEAELLSRGCTKNDAQPTWVLSMLACQDRLYAGASYAAENLSNWNGGMMRLKKDENFISRAEFKLQEALAVFAINLNGGKALDLGAAPGGWTKILLSQGMNVTAVDPAALSERLLRHKNLTHIQAAAQKLNLPPGFDLITNDMRMDLFESSRIMLDMAHLLRPGGLAVMTLKLPAKHWQKNTASALSLLEKSYTVQGARQLFHNRSEVTVALRKNGKLQYNAD